MWGHYFSFLRHSLFSKPAMRADAFNGSYRKVGVIKDSLQINGDAVIGSSSAELTMVDGLVVVNGTFTSENAKFTSAVHVDGVTNISDCNLSTCFINGGFSAFNSVFSTLSFGIGSKFYLTQCHINDLILERSALPHDREIILDSTRVDSIKYLDSSDEKISHPISITLLNSSTITGEIDERVIINDRTSRSAPSP